MTNFRTVTDLNQAIVNRLHEIRNLNVDLIVGIPRSGMIPASLIATHLQLPFTDVDGYNSNRWYVRHKKVTVSADMPKTPFRILLVDDTINTGNAMRHVLSNLKKSNDLILKFAVYGSPKNKLEDIDFVCEICPLPRAFQWNLWKHNDAKNWATDMDGVLCRDPTKKENDKGPSLENFYRIAEPKFLFSKPIKYVITSREERFRDVTVEWLQRYNIVYEKLIMKPTGTPGGNQNHGNYKANIIKNLNNISLYIESDPTQANIVSKIVNMPVWCTDNQTLYER
jgi:hypoxanthine phosphoribosyltransferase